jgi:UDP-3-O-[3-hydroxymyristoyl] glucosamine N-acyltransferase
MNFPAAQISLLVNGKVEGDPNTTVNSFGKIEEAKEQQLTFLPIPNTKNFYIVPKHPL